MDFRVNAIISNNKPQLDLKQKKLKDHKLKESAETKMSFEQHLKREMEK